MEPNLIQTIAVVGFVIKIVCDRDTVRGILKVQHQVVAHSTGSHILSNYAFTQLQHIHSARAGVVVVDGILAVPLVEYIGIATSSSIQGIIAQTASYGVVACLAVQVVVANPTQQGVIAFARI